MEVPQTCLRRALFEVAKGELEAAIKKALKKKSLDYFQVQDLLQQSLNDKDEFLIDRPLAQKLQGCQHLGGCHGLGG